MHQRFRLIRPVASLVLGVVMLVPALHVSAAPSDYVVRPGDSLYAIASRLDVPLDDLLRANGLRLTSVILPGQRLVVPGTGTGGSGGGSGGDSASRGGSTGGSSTYTIRAGDGLARIASSNGVTLSALLAANRLTVSSLIVPGQRLVIPRAGSGGGGSTGGSVGGGSTGGGSTGGSTGGSSTYTVRAGDGLARIASSNGVTLSALLAANRLTVSSLIVPGQRLVIPRTGSGGGGSTGGSVGGGSTGGSAGGSSTYTVQAGDWLARIASRHGVTLDALLSANRLTATSLIVPDQQLRIPRPGAPVTPTQPTQPNRPAQPTQPTQPTQPNRPTQPTQPSRPAAGPTYTVRPGDSLGAIASQHDVTLGALLAVNGFTSTSLITPGMQISLPAGARLNALDRVLGYALSQVGKPWKFFSRGPESFDCSGLTLAAYSQIGVVLIHQSAAQARQGREVDFLREPIRAGDLVFQDTDGDGVINHVGIALSNSAWIHSRSANRPVAWGPMPSASNIVTVRRVLT